MDVIIFGGQSNMQGQSECLSEEAVVENAYEYKFLKDELVPLKNPVGENITYDYKEGYLHIKGAPSDPWRDTHVFGSSCYNHTNLVPEFCRAYVKETGGEVLAVHAAKGNTEISFWLPGSDGYNAVVKKSLGALAKVNPERVFFVWLQGESDAIAGKSISYYKESLTKLCDGLKKDVGIEKFGIIRVGRFVNDERDDRIILAQSEICRENEDFLMLTEIATELNENPEYMNPFVKGHFSAKGLEMLGHEAGKTLGKLC
jgi:hypothetical protein